MIFIVVGSLPKFSPLFLRRTVFFLVVSKYTYHYLRILEFELFAPYMLTLSVGSAMLSVNMFTLTFATGTLNVNT